MPSNSPVGDGHSAPNRALVQFPVKAVIIGPYDDLSPLRRRLVVLARYLWVEGRISAVRILPKYPQMLLVMGLPTVRFVRGSSFNRE